MKAAVPQFTPVAYGMMSAWTISGRYTQTTGPKVRPKLAINKINPMIINANPRPDCYTFM